MKRIVKNYRLTPTIKYISEEYSGSRETIPLSIIIITYESNNHIKKCLQNIKKSTIQPEEVVIVDNNSKVTPKKQIREFLNNHCEEINFKLKLYESNKNLGFSKAVNIGINLSKNTHYLLLNPDLFIYQNSLKNLWLSKKKNNTGIIGGKTYSTTTHDIYPTVVRNLSIFNILIEFTSIKKILKNLGIKENFFWDLKSNYNSNTTRVNAVSGCLFYLNKQIYNKVGKFDENFFLYLEDLDYCLRAQNNKIPIYYNPHISGNHIGGGSSIKQRNKISIYHWRNSKEYFCIKYFGIWGYLLKLIFNIDYLIIKLKKLILPA